MLAAAIYVGGLVEPGACVHTYQAMSKVSAPWKCRVDGGDDPHRNCKIARLPRARGAAGPHPDSSRPPPAPRPMPHPLGQWAS